MCCSGLIEILLYDVGLIGVVMKSRRLPVAISSAEDSHDCIVSYLNLNQARGPCGSCEIICRRHVVVVGGGRRGRCREHGRGRREEPGRGRGRRGGRRRDRGGVRLDVVLRRCRRGRRRVDGRRRRRRRLLLAGVRQTAASRPRPTNQVQPSTSSSSSSSLEGRLSRGVEFGKVR